MPEKRKFLGFHHIHFWVNNAKQASMLYCARLGFKPLAYKGLETGSRQVASYAIVQNKIIFVFTSPLEPNHPKDMYDFLSRHGDEVKDIAFEVDGLKDLLQRAVNAGATVIEPMHESCSEEGFVRSATIKAYGDVTHTFIDRSNYTGTFMPGYVPSGELDPLLNLLPDCLLEELDHVVANLPRSNVDKMTKWYENVMGFHPFWSIDDRVVSTSFTGLKSMVVSDPENKVMITLNEQTKSIKRGQIEEFLDYHGGPGIQHIAFKTSDIVASVRNLRSRGFEFLKCSDSYYDELRKRLESTGIQIKENFTEIAEQRILVDVNEKGGYLLQIVSNVVQDRPTLFLEVIQRNEHTGFGAGNFKDLYTVFEKGQESRGNLI